MRLSFQLSFIALVINVVLAKYIDDDDPAYTSTDPAVREPRPCEVCKYLVTELQMRLEISGRSKERISFGSELDPRQKKSINYHKSELRLIEALDEPHICQKILEYNVHAEREGSNRYGKGTSETMKTLGDLVNKGVQVDLGIPHDLWNEPSAEVSKMHRMCFNMVEEYEDDIRDWYYNYEDKNLLNYLCRDRYLLAKNADPKCLDEVYEPKKGDDGSDLKSAKIKKKKVPTVSKKGTDNKRQKTDKKAKEEL